MKEKYELYEHIYQDAEMSCYTIEILIKNLKDKDNKIKKLVEDIYTEYKYFKDEAKKVLQKNKQEISEKSMGSKLMAKMGTKKEIKSDNSDSAIAELLIQGISMGSIEMERKINEYNTDVNKNSIEFANEFKKFQEKAITELKRYL